MHLAEFSSEKFPSLSSQQKSIFYGKITVEAA